MLARRKLPKAVGFLLQFAGVKEMGKKNSSRQQNGDEHADFSRIDKELYRERT